MVKGALGGSTPSMLQAFHAKPHREAPTTDSPMKPHFAPRGGKIVR